MKELQEVVAGLGRIEEAVDKVLYNRKTKKTKVIKTVKITVENKDEPTRFVKMKSMERLQWKPF